MLGRSALANPLLPSNQPAATGLSQQPIPELDWPALLAGLVVYSQDYAPRYFSRDSDASQAVAKNRQ